MSQSVSPAFAFAELNFKRNQNKTEAAAAGLVKPPLNSEFTLNVDADCGYPGLPAGAELVGGAKVGWEAGQQIWGAGQRVEYRCGPGRELVGTSERTCGEAGDWHPGLPLCSEYKQSIFRLN